jgi:histidinol phosphatase-like PHP family hydrolase
MDTGMGLMDLHNHTVWSDGINSAREVIENAVSYNITDIGITDHFNTNKCPSISPGDIDSYISEIQYLKKLYSDKVNIYAGIEICCIPFPQSLEDLPFDKINKLDFVLLEYTDYLSPHAQFEDIKKSIQKIKCRAGLAHTDLFKLATNRFQDGGLEFVLNFLSENNLFWEINANTAYDCFDNIIYHNNDEHVEDLFDALQNKGIRVSAGSDSHSIYDFKYGRLRDANKVARMINKSRE